MAGNPRAGSPTPNGATSPAEGVHFSRAGDAGGPVGWRAPGWAWRVSWPLSIAGLAVAAYLTYAHFTTAAALSCPDRGFVNCAKVTTSPQSVIAGIPVAVLGLAFFAFLVLVCSPWAWRRSEPVVRWGRLVATVVGIGMVLYLIYAELFVIRSLCLYCTAVHAITVVLFAVVALASTAPTRDPVTPVRPAATGRPAAGRPGRAPSPRGGRSARR